MWENPFPSLKNNTPLKTDSLSLQHPKKQNRIIELSMCMLLEVR